MKRTILAIAFAGTGLIAATSNADVVEYSWEISDTTVELGDTIELTLHASIQPSQSPFYALSLAALNIHVNDSQLGGGVLETAGPGMGLMPEFIVWGDQGTKIGNSVLGVQAAQIGVFGDPVNTSTELDLFTMEYTITDATARTIEFNIDALASTVYTDFTTTLQSNFDSVVNAGYVEVSIPAPGALALLGVSGMMGAGRRRRH